MACCTADLTEEIASAGPEKQSATILGTQVPGLLIVVASPLTLLVLSYYFANHTGHLVRLVKADREEFRGFAWMPLSIQYNIPFLPRGKLKDGFKIPAWALETVISAVILPLASLAALYAQLTQFGGIGLWPSLVISTAVAGIALLGIRTVRNINTIRTGLQAN